MKFIHTSDWHIGRQLHNHSLIDDQKFVLDAIVSLAKEHEVDAVIIAGDIYDRAVPPANAVSLLDETLHKLVNELGIKVIMIAGNHDGHQRLGFAARHMVQNGLHIVGPLSKKLNAITISGKKGAARFYGLPYAEPATVRNIFDIDAKTHQDAMSYLLTGVDKDDSKGLPKVIISHCFLDGGGESDSERPLSIGGADKITPNLFTPYQYVALGHLHGPQYKGASHIRYSGSILKYSFSEQHQNKSVTLVEFDDDGQAHIELLPLPALHDVRIIEGQLSEILAAGLNDEHSSDYVMVRLSDKHAILDAMGKLRSVYPNVLHLERTGLMANNNQLELSRDHVKKGALTMFEDFFSQVSGAELSSLQHDAVEQVIDSLQQAEHNK